MKRILLGVLLLMLLAGFGAQAGHAQVITTARYVDATGGDDAQDGTTAETAWQSLTKVNAATFGPGASILFKAGEQWHGRLRPQGSGSADAPIVIDRYGEGPLPALHGDGLPSVLVLVNQEYWEINNLEITNKEDVNPVLVPKRKRAVHIVARDVGALRHIHLKNLVIHDVNSEVESFDSRYYGGIFFEVQGSKEKTWFDGILVEGCHIYDVDRTGISNDSSWWVRGLDSQFGDVVGYTSSGTPRHDNWVPSLNVVIRNNRLDRIGGNGIIVRVARGALVERNTLFYNGLKISGNAAFCFNTDSTLFQYNEAAYTVYNPGDTDARGIDSDYRTKHTIIQYNYLHDNGYGGVVATGGPGGETSVPRYNYGTVIRYNVLANNRDHIIRASGNLFDMQVYNNVVYTGSEHDEVDVVVHGAWSGAWPRRVSYYNNIFYNLGTYPRYVFGQSTDNTFSHNLFSGSTPINEPIDPHKVREDPQFVDPAPGDSTFASLTGFKLKSSSPAIGAGTWLSDYPEHDFFDNAIPGGASIDIGVHQYTSALSTDVEHTPAPGASADIFPNPATAAVTLRLSSEHAGEARLTLYNLLGREVASRAVQVAAGAQDVSMDFAHRGLSAGPYFLRVQMPEGISFVKKLIWAGRPE